jgi:hypothetical protein
MSIKSVARFEFPSPIWELIVSKHIKLRWKKSAPAEFQD